MIFGVTYVATNPFACAKPRESADSAGASASSSTYFSMMNHWSPQLKQTMREKARRLAQLFFRPSPWERGFASHSGPQSKGQFQSRSRFCWIEHDERTPPQTTHAKKRNSDQRIMSWSAPCEPLFEGLKDWPQWPWG